MKFVIIFVFLLYGLSPLCAQMAKSARTLSLGNEGLKYNFTYNFQTDMKGKILLLVPYRFFHEVSASVNFVARKNKENHYEFCFDGIGETGYVMTTGGLRGTSLYFFTADYDLEKADKFRENKIVDFKKAEPYYSENIRKIRRRPMKILSFTDDAIRFCRDPAGIHYNSQVNIRLTDSRSFTYSNIYKILGKILNLYNHSFLPKGGRRPHPIHGQPDVVLSGASSQRGWHPQPIHGQPDVVLSGASSQRGWHPQPIHGQPDVVLSGASSQKLTENTNFRKVLVKSKLEQLSHRVWFSKPLDFSKPLEEAARLTSEYAEKNTRFKQKQKFRIKYRVTALDNDEIEICGESYPDVSIGKKMKIRHIMRKIKLRLEDEVVTEDMIHLDFRDKKGKGATIRLKLQLLL